MIIKRLISLLAAAAVLASAMLTVSAEGTETTAADPVIEEIPPVSFTDTDGHWAAAAITRFSELGILRGGEDGRFRPDDPVTRAEMAVMLQRIMRYRTAAEELFADLTEDWYRDAIQCLRAAGVMQGDENNCANPASAITREAAVVMLARAFLLEDGEQVLQFPDADLISDWAKGAVSVMAEAGYVRGGDDGSFLPARALTRAEAVTLLDNMITACFYAPGSYDYRPFEGLANFVIIAADDVEVLNFDIGGDILLTEGIDPETVKLKTVNHYGRIMQYTPDGYVRHLKAASYIVPVDESLPTCRHDTELFVKDENGIMTYADPDVKTWFGIDVSSWQGKNIDWHKLREEGVYFAIIRAGYRGYGTGKITPDENAIANIRGALDAGIKVGVYFFSQAINAAEAREEARFVLDMVRDYDISFPIVFDWETITYDEARTDEVETDELCRAANAFCETVAEAGYTPMLYSNQSVSLLNYELGRLQAYDFWYAEYRDQPTFYYDFDMWQYGATGHFAGIPDADVDVNISFVDYSAQKN